MDGRRYGQKGRESTYKFYPHDFEIFGYIVGDYILYTKFTQSGPVWSCGRRRQSGPVWSCGRRRVRDH